MIAEGALSVVAVDEEGMKLHLADLQRLPDGVQAVGVGRSGAKDLKASLEDVVGQTDLQRGRGKGRV